MIAVSEARGDGGQDCGREEEEMSTFKSSLGHGTLSPSSTRQQDLKAEWDPVCPWLPNFSVFPVLMGWNPEPLTWPAARASPQPQHSSPRISLCSGLRAFHPLFPLSEALFQHLPQGGTPPLLVFWGSGWMSPPQSRLPGPSKGGRGPYYDLPQHLMCVLPRLTAICHSLFFIALVSCLSLCEEFVRARTKSILFTQHSTYPGTT